MAQNSAAVKRFIRKVGWRTKTADLVIEFGEGHETTNGGTARNNGTVYFKRGLSPRTLLWVALHEAGHVVAYNTGWPVKRSRHHTHIRSETIAMLYGSAIAEQLGIRLNQKAWREFNWEAR